MTASRGRNELASNTWMLAQQLRAEMEAEAWRRLRAEMPAPPAEIEPLDYHRSGSAVLKALVRFTLGVFGAYLGWLAAMDSNLGEVETWFAAGAGFAITLALSMFGYARDLVHTLAETARWIIVSAVALGAVWLVLQIA